jgi:hypothetical protein
LNIWYLDDGTLGGKASDVLHDLEKFICDLKKIGLTLNFNKCELYFFDSVSPNDKSIFMDKFQSLTSGLHICNNEDFFLLGCPILDEAIPLFFSKKIEKFSLLSANLCKMNPHISLFLLRHCFWIPKFIYLLRCCPFWKFKHFCLD